MRGITYTSFLRGAREFDGTELLRGTPTRGVEGANSRLKKLLAEAMLRIKVLKVTVKEKRKSAGKTRGGRDEPGEAQHFRALLILDVAKIEL